MAHFSLILEFIKDTTKFMNYFVKMSALYVHHVTKKNLLHEILHSIKFLKFQSIYMKTFICLN